MRYAVYGPLRPEREVAADWLASGEHQGDGGAG